MGAYHTIFDYGKMKVGFADSAWQKHFTAIRLSSTEQNMVVPKYMGSCFQFYLLLHIVVIKCLHRKRYSCKPETCQFTVLVLVMYNNWVMETPRCAKFMF
jgi:hypothetical protein